MLWLLLTTLQLCSVRANYDVERKQKRAEWEWFKITDKAQGGRGHLVPVGLDGYKTTMSSWNTWALGTRVPLYSVNIFWGSRRGRGRMGYVLCREVDLKRCLWWEWAIVSGLLATWGHVDIWAQTAARAMSGSTFLQQLRSPSVANVTTETNVNHMCWADPTTHWLWDSWLHPKKRTGLPPLHHGMGELALPLSLALIREG